MDRAYLAFKASPDTGIEKEAYSLAIWWIEDGNCTFTKLRFEGKSRAFSEMKAYFTQLPQKESY